MRIEDLNANALETWNSPEPFAAGICAAIPSDGIPIGTLWLFSDENTQFSDAESAAARFAASQIGLELAHASVGPQDHLKNLREPVRDLAQWQYESLPVGAVVAGREPDLDLLLVTEDLALQGEAVDPAARAVRLGATTR